MSLSSLLLSSLASSVGDDGGRWRQFILDHLDYITQRSQTYTLTPQLMYRYRYDLERFLKTYEGIRRQEDICWIVLLLNNWPNDFSFNTVEKCIIPSDDLILKLYHSYLSIQNNAA